MQGRVQSNGRNLLHGLWRKVFLFSSLKGRALSGSGLGKWRAEHFTASVTHPAPWGLGQLPSPPAFTLAKTMALPCTLTGLVWPESGHHGTAQRRSTRDSREEYASKRKTPQFSEKQCLTREN